jgi:hypothetical protein
MGLWANESFEFAAHCVASMDIAVTLFLANRIAVKLLFCLLSFIALYFSLHCPAAARLLHNYFAICTSPLMANLRALVAT